MKLNSSLKNILTFNFIIVVTVPIVIISGVTLFLLTKNLEHEITNKQMFLAASLAGEIENILDDQQSALGIVENYHDLEGSMQPAQLDQFLQSVIDNYQYFDMIQIVDDNGRVMHVAPLKKEYLGTSISGNSFFNEAKRLERPYCSSIFTSTQTERPTIAVVRSIRVGMIVGYIDISQFNDLINLVYIGENGWAELIDRNGNYISHTRKSHVHQSVTLNKNKYVHRQITGNPGSYRYRQNGQEFLANVISVSENGWSIIISQPSKDAFMPVRITRNIFLMGTCGALVLAYLIAVGSLSQVLRPIAGFAAWARQVATGDYQDVLEIHKTYREFKELGMGLGYSE